MWANWSGKSSLLKTILWITNAHSWIVKFMWEQINSWNINRIWYAPDIFLWYEKVKVVDYFNVLSKLYSVNLLEYWFYSDLEKFWLLDLLNTKIWSLSLWNQKKVLLLWSLVNDPDLIIRDEPLNWLDMFWREIIRQKIIDLKEKWCSILITTHFLDNLETVLDKMFLLENGRIQKSTPSLSTAVLRGGSGMNNKI
jgi:ABC-2 type transport system ATP-binding protein